MSSYIGDDLIRKALREIGVLDPTEAGGAEVLKDARDVASDMLDQWAADNLLIPAVTRSPFTLTQNVQTYSIGAGATLAQADYPTKILEWSAVADVTATDPVELPMGEPYTFDQWQAIRNKTQKGPYPRHLWFDQTYDANARGNLLVHPIPNVTTAGIVLYQLIAAISAIAANTTYQLRKGWAMAIITNLAVHLGQGRFARTGGLPDGLERRAMKAIGIIRRANYHPRQSPIRSEFVIGSGATRRSFNILLGSST